MKRIPPAARSPCVSSTSSRASSAAERAATQSPLAMLTLGLLKDIAHLEPYGAQNPKPKFMTGDLGILELDSGRYVPTGSGVVPRRVQEHIEAEGGLGGTTLLAYFGAAPYGYTANVVKACVAGVPAES